MKLGFTGTRKGMTDAQRSAFGQWLYGRTIAAFHHGSCQGADVQAARVVHEESRTCPVIICHPGPDGDPHKACSGVDSEIRPPKTHFARNRDIVDETDCLVAAPCDMTEQPRGGTWYTVNYARKQGKSVAIIWPDGRVEEGKP